MILDDGMVADVIAAPHDNIVPDFNEWLNGVVFENKAVVAALKPGKSRRL